MASLLAPLQTDLERHIHEQLSVDETWTTLNEVLDRYWQNEEIMEVDSRIADAQEDIYSRNLPAHTENRLLHIVWAKGLAEIVLILQDSSILPIQRNVSRRY